MNFSFSINGRVISQDSPPYFIAEISANHRQDINAALRLIEIAAKSGADAVKIQHYRPDTITVNSKLPEFRVSGGTIWDDKELYDLYQEAMTPWEWTESLFDYAKSCGICCFSTPFDETAVDFLENFDVPAYKIASFELVDLPLIRKVASTGKPIIISTGMATEEEIDRAVEAVSSQGNRQLALLRCNSGYPALVEEMDLRAIPYMRNRWGCEIGFSDHALNSTSSCVAVALGASIIEKHVVESRALGGPDAAFSIEPHELSETVSRLKDAHASIGEIRFGPTKREESSIRFRPSLRAVSEIKRGEKLTADNVKSVRPSGAMLPDQIGEVIGKTVTRDVPIGMQISPELWS